MAAPKRGKKEKTQPIPSKDREDRAKKIKTTFDRLRIDCFEPSTVLLLLDSVEENVVQRAIVALDKYAAKSNENLEKLFELKAHTRITPLLYAADVYIQRFAVKLLAELCTLTQVRKDIAEMQEITFEILKFFSEDVDLVNNEFSGMILAELTLEATLVDQLLETNILDVVFIRMLSADPDTQKHSLQILLNLQIDPLIKDKIVACPSFKFYPLLSHTRSEFPIIQELALKIMRSVLENVHEPLLHAMFLKSKGLETMLETVQMFIWRDLHEHALSILEVCALAPETTSYFHERNMTPELVIYINDIHNPVLEERALKVFNNMTQFALGRRVLFDLGLVQILVKCIRQDDPSLAGTACSGIAYLLPYPPAVFAIADEYIEVIIFKLFTSQFRTWKIRTQAAFALCQLSRYDIKTAYNMLEVGRLENVFKIMAEQETPLEMAQILLQWIINLLQIPAIREQVADHGLVDSLVNSIIKKVDFPEKLVLLGFEALTIALCESNACRAFLRQHIETTVLNYLLTHHIPLRVQVMALMLNACRNQEIALAFIDQGAIQFFYTYKKIKSHLTIWDELLNLLFKAHLPTKFAHTNRLDITDITKEGFYLFRHTPDEKMRNLTLEKLLKTCSTPYQIMYVANFRNPSPPPLEEASENEKAKNIEKLDDDFKVDEDLEEKIHNIYCKCFTDDGLPGALKQLNLQLEGKTPGPLENIVRKACTSEERAVILAEFVCGELSGPCEESYTSPHLIDLHVTYLKVELGTSLIPLGRLKVGQYIERAMLFKVLADRINIPCSLVRGQYARAWVEIAIAKEESTYQLMDIDSPNTMPSFPTRLLLPNFIVNLMDKPGKLIPIGTAEADIYCAREF